MLALNRLRRLLLAAALTASFLALACSSASAIQLSLSEPTFRVVWTPARFTFSGVTVSCNVTLEGSFHSTSLTKVTGSLIGYVTRATPGSCSNGTMSVLTATLPWHVQFGSFTGTLPNITTMTTRVIGMSASWTFLGLTCLGRTEAGTPAGLIAERNGAGTLTSFRWDESLPIPLTGSAGCSSIRGRIGGTSSSATGAGSVRAITLSLIGEAPTLSPSPVEFGVVEAEGVASRNVTIRANSGSVTVRSIALRSGTSFAWLDPNRCIGSTLPERGTCVLRVIFTAPRETGRAFEDTLSVASNVHTVTSTVRAST
jgi:hypothetical protein